MNQQTNKNIRFSVITVCFNSEKTIEKTLQCIKDQTYENIEYIVIDGGSTDQTLIIIDKYADMIDVLVSEPDNGIYDAMNKGLKLATGDYIGFLNSDDYYTDDIFEEYARALGCGKYDFVYSDAFFFNKNYKWISKGIEFGTNSFYKHVRKYQPFCHQTLYVKRKVYSQEGSFDTSLEISADYDFFLRLLHSTNNYKGYYVNIVSCYFSVLGASSNFLKARLEDIQCRHKNGYSYTFSIYIFIKQIFFHILQKLPLMKKIKRFIKKEKIIKVR
jgi:glycosyltransferase involved in cell wall biosynthesis